MTSTAYGSYDIILDCNWYKDMLFADGLPEMGLWSVTFFLESSQKLTVKITLT